MIQLQFPSIQNIPRNLPPIAPTTIASSSTNIPTVPLLRLHNHRRRGQFTEKIVKHGGPGRDTTLNAATKLKQREIKQYEKNFTSIDEMTEQFEKEKQEVLKYQAKITYQQRILASKLLKWYSIQSIQLVWRSYLAKRALRRLRASRFLSQWIGFQLYYQKLKKAASIINRRIKVTLARRAYLKLVRRNRAAIIIQKNIRRKLAFQHLLFGIFKLSRMKRFIDHITLFGKRRALRFLLKGPKVEEQTKRVVGRAFIAQCARKRRIKLLKGPLGKAAFYVLSRFYVEDTAIPHNKVIEYIRKRYLSLEDKTYRRRNLSSKQVNDLNIKSKAGKISPHGKGTPAGKDKQQPQTPTQPDHNEGQAALWTIDDLPHLFHGIYAPKTVPDVMLLIHDLFEIAVKHPSYLDDSIVPVHPSTIHSPTGKKSYGRAREGQGPSAKQIMTLNNSSRNKIGRSGSQDESNDTPRSASSSASSSSVGSHQRHATIYNQSHPKNKFVKKENVMLGHGAANTASSGEFTAHPNLFTPTPPPPNIRMTEMKKVRPTKYGTNNQSRSNTIGAEVIAEIEEDVEDDDSRKGLVQTDSFNTDSSDEEHDGDGKSPKDKIIVGNGRRGGSSHNPGNTPINTQHVAGNADRQTKAGGLIRRQTSSDTPESSSSRSSSKQQSVSSINPLTAPIVPSKIAKDQSNQTKRTSKATNIISSVNEKQSISKAEEDQLKFPTVSTPTLQPIHHQANLTDFTIVEQEDEEENDDVSIGSNVTLPPNDKSGASNGLNSTLTSTLNYSESEDEATPFKSFAENAPKFSTSSLLSAVDFSSSIAIMEEKTDNQKDDFRSSEEAVGLSFPVPESPMIELFGTGFHLDDESKQT